MSAAGGSFTNSNASGETITLTGGAASSNTVLTVATTGVVGATVAVTGAGGTSGTQPVTGTTGVGTLVTASITVTDGGITEVRSVTPGNSYTTNPTVLSAEPVTGGGLPGAKLNLGMGVSTVTVTTPRVNSTVSSSPVAQGSSSGTATGATFSVGICVG